MGNLIIYYLLIFLLVFAAVSWRNLRVAVYLILACLPLYLIKFKFGPIPTTLLELMLYTSVAVWLAQVFLRRVNINWPVVRYYAEPLLFVAVGLFLGVVVSTDKNLSLGIVKGWFVDPLLLFALMTSVLDRHLHIKKSIVALMLPAIILSAFAVYQVVTHNFITVDQRASSVFSSANYLSLFLVPVMILSLGLFSSVARKFRWWVVVSWLLMATALYFTFSYAGWLGALVGIGVFALLLTRWWWAAAGGVVALALAVASQLQHPKFQQMLDLAGRSSSHVRLQVWQTAWLMIRENYLSGIGLGLFEKRYLGFAQRLFHPPLELKMLHSHNIILQFMVNTGIFGTVGFLWLLLNFLRRIWGEAVSGKNVLAAAIFASMAALLTHGMLDLAYWKNDLSALFWVILAFGIILGPLSVDARRYSHNRN